MVAESFEDFKNGKVEEKHLKVKRKYSNHPEIKASIDAPVRTKVLKFIHQEGEVNEEDFKRYLKRVSQERNLKRNIKPSEFVERNRTYVKKVNRGKKGFGYKLSAYGERMLKMMDKSLN